MPFDADDIATFNDPDMPGYALATIGALSVHGRFRAAYAEAMGFVGGSSPAFSGASSELASVNEGASVSIGGTSYTVSGIEPDGIAHTRLKLESV